ncbi:hypothetical protein NC651_015830 [Populus alba x Populus x berolinensis]|nr:hypothetical protein NC651_015830 [Populus alba x Populus x berolinensis]
MIAMSKKSTPLVPSSTFQDQLLTPRPSLNFRFVYSIHISYFLVCPFNPTFKLKAEGFVCGWSPQQSHGHNSNKTKNSHVRGLANCLSAIAFILLVPISSFYGGSILVEKIVENLYPSILSPVHTGSSPSSSRELISFLYRKRERDI